MLPLLALLAGPRADSGEGPTIRPMPVRALKAGYLYKFTRYVEWPTNAFATTNAPFVIGVLKDKDNVVGALKEVVQGRKVDTHPVVVRALSRVEDVPGCHILYVAGNDRQLLTDTLQALGRSPVLVVGDRGDTLDLGGAISFLELDNNLHINMRPAAARRHGVEISAKLNPVAKSVDRREMPPQPAP